MSLEKFCNKCGDMLLEHEGILCDGCSPPQSPSDILLEEHILYNFAVKKWGKDAQLWMFIEEAGELFHDISKWLRGRPNDIINEIVDVEIMLNQLKWIIYENGDWPDTVTYRNHLDDCKRNKLMRLKEKLAKE